MKKAPTIRPNKRRYTIAFYVLSGWLPWGTDLDRGKADRSGGSFAQVSKDYWPICCGHVLRDDEVIAWQAAGLLSAGPRVRGMPSLRAGPELDRWISDAWHDLQVRSWSRG